MVRLMLTLTPVVCVLAAIAFSKTFEIYLKDDAPKSSGKEASEEPAESKNDRLYDKVRGRGRNSSIWWHVLWNFLKLTIKSLLKYTVINITSAYLLVPWFVCILLVFFCKKMHARVCLIWQAFLMSFLSDERLAKPRKQKRRNPKTRTPWEWTSRQLWS